MYTPTWRDTDYTPGQGFQYKNPVNLKKVVDSIPPECVLLFRAHHQNGLSEVIESSDRIIDVTDVDDINELYIISDLMVTDYSSTMFDFSNLKRPMVFHMYDREVYEEKIRRFYFDLSLLPGPITKTEG